MKPPPLVDPDQTLSDGYRITLPFPMARRVEDDSIVFWHTPMGLTYWIRSLERGNQDDPVERWQDIRPVDGCDEIVERDDNVTRYGFRLEEKSDDNRQAAFYGFVAGPAREVWISAYFDEEEAFPAVLETWRSIRPGPPRLN